MTTSSSGDIHRWTEEEDEQVVDYVDEDLRTSVRANSGFL